MLAVTITAMHFTVSDRLRDYVDEKYAKLTTFDASIDRVELTIHKEPNRFAVQGIAHRGHGAPFVAKVEAETVYGALDRLFERCRKQARRTHRKEVHDAHCA